MSSLRRKLRRLASLPATVFFNFWYLPVRQAWRLPIVLERPVFFSLRGKIEIQAERVSFAMILLGTYANGAYPPETGIVWDNRGGKCIFSARTVIMSGSSIVIGKSGTLLLGEDLAAGPRIRFIAMHSVHIGAHARVGWESTIMDSDFHEIVNIHTRRRSVPSKEVRIGRNCWIGTRSLILKGTVLPDYCIVGAGSLINRDQGFPPYSIVAGNPVELKAEGWMRDLDSFVQ